VAHLTFLVDKRSLFMAVKLLIFVSTYKSPKLTKRFQTSLPLFGRIETLYSDVCTMSFINGQKKVWYYYYFG